LSRAWGGEGKRVSGLLEPLSGLLMQGEVELSAMPVEEPGERAEVLALLREAYWHYQLDLAGPRLPFAGATALAAASWCLAACWFVVSRQEPDEFVERTLDWQPQLRDAADHLAADLTLRYLPRVLQRARLLGREDGLVRAIARLAGRVPLAGVLLDVPPGRAEIPTTLGTMPGCICSTPSGSPPTPGRVVAIRRAAAADVRGGPGPPTTSVAHAPSSRRARRWLMQRRWLRSRATRPDERMVD
jgi:hypothetical protein